LKPNHIEETHQTYGHLQFSHKHNINARGYFFTSLNSTHESLFLSLNGMITQPIS
jgi:hypothetical protein